STTSAHRIRGCMDKSSSNSRLPGRAGLRVTVRLTWESAMGRVLQKVILAMMVASLLLQGAAQVRAADAEIDRLLQSPVGKDWVTNGGNMTNQRYSTLKQIDTTNVKQLKGAWMTRLKGSGLGGKYSLEATPLIKDGIMYISTGNDDVFALDAKTGQI